MNFFDTSSLMRMADRLDADTEPFFISSITLQELENIKTSAHKDPHVKYLARQVSIFLDKYSSKVEVITYKTSMLLPLLRYEKTPDLKILACAIYAHKHVNKTITFYSDDRSFRNIARSAGLAVAQVKVDEADDYTGFITVEVTDEELANFYNNINSNVFNLYVNQYIILTQNDKAVDKYYWNGETHHALSFEKQFHSFQLGEIKAYKDDVYQDLAIDCLARNQISMLRGPAGAGKSHLALGYLFDRLERGKIDKIIIFCNTVRAKNAAKLGFYPGTKDEKLLDSQIGNMLASKLGGKEAVIGLINSGELELLPFADIRGYDSSGKRAGIYITEAQNLDIALMKLAIQRTGEDCIMILDGDDKTQVDDVSFAGANNGMRRASKVFRGHNMYGEVTLQCIHRSKIAEIAEQM